MLCLFTSPPWLTAGNRCDPAAYSENAAQRNESRGPELLLWTAAAPSLRAERHVHSGAAIDPCRRRALRKARCPSRQRRDADDQLWAIEAIMDYNPEPDLHKVKAKVLLINAEEDEAPELGTVERR